MKVYFISGLGADSRVFRNIQLPSHCSPVYLDWLEPQKDETLPKYAIRLAEAIDDTEPFSIIGLSFGGMLAVEIAKQKNPVALILISTISCVKHLPKYYVYAGKLGLHKIIPISLIQHASILKRLFTTESTEDKKILKNMIRNVDPKFIRWAMNAVVTWDCTDPPKKYYHIHGTKDEILPLRFTAPTHLIKKGGHLMVMNCAREINKILAEILS